jgi:23S rRNA (guanosine2251-2'-O)-methyltransferase
MTRARGDGGLGGEQVEGRNAVCELLRAGRRRTQTVFVDRPDHDVASLAVDAGVEVRVVDDLDGRARTEAPQGVVARAEPVVTEGLTDLLTGDRPFVVALDGVTDPGNLGAILRSALAAGATGVVLPRARGALLTPTAVKAAAGAVEHLRFALVGGIAGALEEVRRRGVWSVGLDADGDQDLFTLDLLDAGLVLVLGAEGRGIAPLTRKRCDVVARIMMRGPLDSLNVAAAAAIACFEVARHR